MNKKFILTSILAISFAMPAVAKQAQKSIGGSTTCDTATLGQSENNSTANVEAKWFPNTINIHWYSDNQKLTVSNDAASCFYDTTITLPTQPTRTGYTFAGWRLVAGATTEQCVAISDTTQCDNTPGCQNQFCTNSTGCCHLTNNCRAIDNQTECENSVFARGKCNWTNAGCILGTIRDADMPKE